MFDCSKRKCPVAQGNKLIRKVLITTVHFVNLALHFKLIIVFQATAIFKAFYDHDIIDEEVILEWGKKVSKKYVSKALSEKIHEKVKPFITWLKEAEEEESDESDEDVELEFDERVHSSGIKEKVMKCYFQCSQYIHG